MEEGVAFVISLMQQHLSTCWTGSRLTARVALSKPIRRCSFLPTSTNNITKQAQPGTIIFSSVRGLGKYSSFWLLTYDLV
jgi:hypothetical protein